MAPMNRKSATASDVSACRWCEQPPSQCPDTWGHARLYGSSEWTWIRTARKAVTR